MNVWPFREQPGHDAPLWPVLVLLALVVLAPTAVLTWLVGRAAENERLVVRQRAVETHRASLQQAQAALEARLDWSLERGDAASGDESVDRMRRELSEQGYCDAVVRINEEGRVVYPVLLASGGNDELSGLSAWSDSVRSEFQENDPRRAADQYAAIADASEHPDVIARARLAQARCLGKAGDNVAAIRIFLELLHSPAAPHAKDPQQRLIAADAGLRAIELMQAGGFSEKQGAAALTRLMELVSGDASPGMPTSQRCFVGRRLRELFPGEGMAPWLESEELAVDYVASSPPASPPGVLSPTSLNAVWQIRSPQGRVVLLFREASLRSNVEAIARRSSAAGPRVVLLSPAEKEQSDQYVAVTQAARMPGWRLAIESGGESSLDEAAGRQIAVYAWTAVLTVVAVAVVAVALAGAIRRQHRLRRLQNDWLATVSHELKTPLASIQLLTDALLDHDPVDQNAYLRMISTEAGRLTRLIERLLSLTRLEGAVAELDRTACRPEELVTAACDALGERLRRPTCDLQVHVESDLPTILADRDALEAVLINLLENAWKFTPGEKRITISAAREGDSVCFRVTDNGIGLSPRDARRVFERFFQVDRRLNREHGGCGLGLCIVKQLVEAHGGTVAVESAPGQGAAFTVRIPGVVVAPTEERRSKEVAQSS